MNGLTDLWHPTQMLADILTVQENFNYNIKGKTRLHGRRQQRRPLLMVVCAKLGMNPSPGALECWPTDDVIEACRPIAEANGCTVSLTDDPGRVYGTMPSTLTWVSMGEPDEV